jgi:serine protease AprX
MNLKPSSSLVSLLLIYSILLSSPAFAALQSTKANKAANSDLTRSVSTVDEKNRIPFAALTKEATDLTELSRQGYFAQTSSGENKEVNLTANVFAQTNKNVILIAEELNRAVQTVEQFARKITSNEFSELKNKSVWRLDFCTLIESSETDGEARDRMKAVLADAIRSRGNAVIFVEDFNIALTQPEIGPLVISAIAQDKVRVVGAMRENEFKTVIMSDNRLSRYFQIIVLPENANTINQDGFVGDKISPDLRDLMKNGDPNKKVTVILQSDDIKNPDLLAILQRNDVVIETQIESMNMLVVKLPVHAAEAIAAHRSAKHLSLDRNIKMFGHIETTTGTTLARSATSSGGSVALDGTGIGIAIVDSSVRDDHRAFLDYTGAKRIVQKIDFSGDDRLAEDEYGHGTHVASLAAGGIGKIGDSNDANYLLNYRGIAPNARIINVRVLNEEGTGTTARLITALDWILANRTSNNIRVVNLSLGAPAVESWRNDPLCRAVRRLTAAGIVVVAAAGNNGKDANGQKIYGAIHSPGNDPTVITVGATNTLGTDARDDDKVATFSSRGPTRSFWTDNNGVKQYDHLIKPDLVAPGNQLIAARAKDSVIVQNNSQLTVQNNADDKRKMMYMSGTSMATPIVSGAVALMLQANPKLTPNMIKMILQYTAQPLAGFNTLEQGAGELNVEGAIRLAKLVRQNLPNPTPLGEPLLTTTILPVHTSVIAGTTFQWAGGMLPSYATITSTELITEYQKIYGNGMVVNDGIIVNDGMVVTDGILMSDGMVVTDGILMSDGAVLNNTAPNGFSTINLGARLYPSSQLFNNNLPMPDRMLFGDGILMSDGMLVNDGILMSDGAISQSNRIIANGDDTARMQ